MRVYLFSEHATMPTKANPTDAGYDLYASQVQVIPTGKRALVSTGLNVEIDSGYYGRVAPRSGLACKGIDVGAGVVDSGYRGELKVLLINNSENDYTVNVKDRVAQLIMERIYTDELVQSTSPLIVSDRGTAGFGSTGV